MRNFRDSEGRVSRRRYVQLLLGAGAAGLAGCPQSDDGAPTDGESAATGTADGMSGQSTDGEETATTGDDSTEDTESEGEPVTDTLRFAIDNSAEQMNLNEWQASDNSSGITWLTELTYGSHVENQERLLAPTFETPWHPDTEEVTVATWYTGYEIDEPFDVYETHDDRLTYWDGTPLDAEARELHERVQWNYEGNQFAEGVTFNQEAASQWEYHWWENKGEGENQQEEPKSRAVLDAGALFSGVPMHPDFTEPFVEQYDDASSSEEAQSVTDDLTGTRITPGEFAENDWGSGLYRLESPDDVGSERVRLSAWEDHPNYEHANVPNLVLRFATQDRQQVLASEGEIDMHGNIVQQEGGQFNREMLPDHMQELARWLQLGGDKWLINWNNDHLSRLWVRRALVTAVDWETVGSNGWGDERSVPVQYQTGLLDQINELEFSEEFLESLHTWPMEADTETAADYMRRAGYERNGNQWVDPDGNPFEIDLTATTGIQDYIGAAQTIQANLQSFGVGVNYTGQEWSTWIDSMDVQNNPSLNYDTTIYWHGQERAFQYYWSEGSPDAEPMLGGDSNDEGDALRVDYETAGDRTRDTHDLQGKPLQVEIPTEPGVIEAPDEAGAAPSLDGGEEIDLARIVHRLREPIDEEEYVELIQKCAIYYNFYLPDFLFHQYTWGTWGNVRDFEWPPSDHDAILTEHDWSVEDFVIQGGIVQPSYDEDYPDP